MKIGVRVHDFGKSNAKTLASKAKSVGFDAVQLVLNKAIEGESGLAGTLSSDKALSFYNDAENYSYYCILGVDSDTQSLAAGSEKLTYEITDVAPTYLENSFVSFLFAGNYYTAGSAHPTEFVRTLNIDIEKGEAYGLDDICKDTDSLTELFENGDAFALIPTGNSIADSELSEMSRVGLGYFTGAYFIDENGETYFAVSIEIPHVLGDHAEYKAKLSDVEQLLDSGIITLTKGNN